MTPVDDWRIILRHAWSVRWHGAAVIFGAFATGWQFAEGLFPISQAAFFAIAVALPLLAAICGSIGWVTHLLKQKNYPRGK